MVHQWEKPGEGSSYTVVEGFSERNQVQRWRGRCGEEQVACMPHEHGTSEASTYPQTHGQCRVRTHWGHLLPARAATRKQTAAFSAKGRDQPHTLPCLGSQGRRHIGFPPRAKLANPSNPQSFYHSIQSAASWQGCSLWSHLPGICLAAG